MAQVWESDFRDKLRIRDRGQHARCTTCCKHQAIISRLSENRAARMAQCQRWDRHMLRQYEDRKEYWSNRAASRLGADIHGEKVLTLIIDSMDRSKWLLPRSSALQSKSFAQFSRPCLDCTGVLVHGKFFGIYFSEPHIRKSSDWTVEVLVNVLEKIAADGQLDLREYTLCIHGDNCSKEIKNNSMCRFLALLTARNRIKRARLATLQSGHSHEDIDQCFSLLGTYLQSQREIHCPADFIDSLKAYLANTSVRPQEPLRDVVKVDRVRAWNLAGIKLFRSLSL